MEGGFTTRRSTAGDFEAWFALFEEVAAEGRWIGREAPIDREWGIQAFDGHLDRDDAVSFLAEADGLLVGVLGASITHGVADLGMLVRDGHRGHGIGRALLQACIDWSRAAGAHKVVLDVWPHNGAAVALYERCGFAIEGRRVRHHRRRNGELWDAISMGLVLDTTAPGSPYADDSGRPAVGPVMTDAIDLPKIGAPATRALNGAGYTSLHQLNGVPQADLEKLHGMGPKALRILGEALRDHGWALG